AGCATAGGARVALEGESRGRNVAMQVSGELAGASAKLKLEVENVTDEAVGLDVDEIRLQGEGGKLVKVLGRPQGFRASDGAKSTGRVPHGPATVPPHER